MYLTRPAFVFVFAFAFVFVFVFLFLFAFAFALVFVFVGGWRAPFDVACIQLNCVKLNSIGKS